MQYTDLVCWYPWKKSNHFKRNACCFNSVCNILVSCVMFFIHIINVTLFYHLCCWLSVQVIKWYHIIYYDIIHYDFIIITCYNTNAMLRHVTHMDEAGVDVIRRVGVSRQNNSGVIVCDKYKKKSKVVFMPCYI